MFLVLWLSKAYLDDEQVLCWPPVETFSIGAGAHNIDHLQGQCVGVHWEDRGGPKHATVVVGQTLPKDVSRCSKAAAGRNIPAGWDFSAAGMCGKGTTGRGYWRDCLIHDVCVWANCHRDDAIPGGWILLRLVGNDPSRDPDCGAEYDAAFDDWVNANMISCKADSDCETGRCAWKYGLHCLPRLPLHHVCEGHSDCESGRCALSGTLPTCEEKLRPRAGPDAAGAWDAGTVLQSRSRSR